MRNKNSIIFLDMDEAILKTLPFKEAASLFKMDKSTWKRFLKEAPQDIISVCDACDIKIVIIDDEAWATKLRPKFLKFLKKVKKLADCVCVLTAGGYDFQSQILDAHGIYNLFDGVYSSAYPEDWHLVPKVNNCILIDNLPVGSEPINCKMTAMGVIPFKNAKSKTRCFDHHVQIAPYEGAFEPDGEFDRIFSYLKVRLK